MPNMSPIGALTNRFSNIRDGLQNQMANMNSPRSSMNRGVSKERQLRKVELLVRDPVLWAEFKRRVAARNHFSNAGVQYVLHELCDELNIPGLDLIDDSSSIQTAKSTQSNRRASFTGSNKAGNDNVPTKNRFGLLRTLRMGTREPPTPEVSYSHSPRSHFNKVPCPESPGSQLNLSPTKTPLTPMSATTASTAATMTPASDVTLPKEIRARGPVLDFLEQPNF
ncbi:expressed unknown protein [Seminavis robusta]|uniref:Uncharacterized protein n=1 Tax=Seminavis robusta TaxID=568900 RepID=A0A9N8HFE2_9STRA|nr:expressed unknown protein [Seminavis robusta]|eukprot:Sro431_g141490.1 n/a (224) ;mRNA; f:46981-47652